MATSPRFTKTVVRVPRVEITDTTLTTVYAANATYDTRITGITVSCDDSSAQTLKFYVNDGTNDVQVGFVSIPITAGTATNQAVGIIASLPGVFREKDSNGVTILNLPIGGSLKVQMAAVTGGKKFWVFIKAELYD